MTIPYQCERLHNQRSITVVLPAFHVPKCGNCGELVFTYYTEDQINLACQAQTSDLDNRVMPTNGKEVKAVASRVTSQSAT